MKLMSVQSSSSSLVYTKIESHERLIFDNESQSLMTKALTKSFDACLDCANIRLTCMLCEILITKLNLISISKGLSIKNSEF